MTRALDVAVKPLVWEGPFCGFYEAVTVGGKVSVMDDLRERPEGRYILRPATNERRRYHTLEEAFAAADREHAAAVRELLA